MTQTINDKKISIHFSDSGQGTPVVLLHGFMENLMVWDDFAKELAASTRVIAIDLPGHGKTECFGETCTMDQMAKVVKAVLDHLSIEKCYLIGHSMGGYVTLAFAENHPERLWGFSLFHSVATPDTEEKKKARQQTINKINEDKKDEVILSHVPKTFATDNLDTFRKKIIKVTQDSL